MGYVTRDTVNITTDASGDATGYTTARMGRVISVAYAKDGTTPFTDGVDFTITTELSLQNVWVEVNVNASKTVVPRQATHDTAGVASLYAAGGEPVEDYVVAADERIKIVVANGGNAKLGQFIVTVG